MVFFLALSLPSYDLREAPTPVLLPGKSHGQRSLVGCSPWGRKESDMPERLHFHSSLSCIGEGNGSPLQYSCLENPKDGGAWWAAVYGVTQSRTRLKRLSSSSSSILYALREGATYHFLQSGMVCDILEVSVPWTFECQNIHVGCLFSRSLTTISTSSVDIGLFRFITFSQNTFL